jgi:hypothetical protein
MNLTKPEPRVHLIIYKEVVESGGVILSPHAERNEYEDLMNSVLEGSGKGFGDAYFDQKGAIDTYVQVKKGEGEATVDSGFASGGGDEVRRTGHGGMYVQSGNGNGNDVAMRMPVQGAADGVGVVVGAMDASNGHVPNWGGGEAVRVGANLSLDPSPSGEIVDVEAARRPHEVLCVCVCV